MRLPLLGLKDPELDLEKIELTLKRLMGLIWLSLLVVIIFKILVNLTVESIMGMELLDIITIITLLKLETLSMERLIQIIMGLHLHLNRDLSLL